MLKPPGSMMFRQVFARCVACAGESSSVSISRARLSGRSSARKARDFRHARNRPGQVEIDAADELLVAGPRRRLRAPPP